MDEGQLLELRIRRGVAMEAVRVLEEEKEDPRAPDALEYYRAQLAGIEEKIEAMTPPPIVVGLKTATVSVRAGH
jgi:hypothetical protein